MSAIQQLLASYGAGVTPITAPTDLPSLLAWYDASDTSSLTLSGSKVTNISDKAGNGYGLVQATDANRFTTGGSVNSLNACTGTNAWYNFTGTKPALTTGAFYIFAVGGQTANCIWIEGNGAGSNPYAVNPRTTGVMYSSLPDGDILGLTGLGAASSNGSINLMRHNAGTNSVVEFNSSSYTENSVNDGFTIQLMFGRSGFQLTGTFCEVFFGNSNLTSTQIAATKSYLKTKWATP